MHWFGVVQVHRTTSNLLQLHHCWDSKVCRVLSHEFWVVRLYLTFSNYIFRGEAICVQDAYALVRGRKCIEPPRTFLNYIIAERSRCVEFFHTLTTSLEGKQFVCRMLMHWFGVVQADRTSSNLLELHHCRESKVCRVLSHEFRVVRLYRTFSNYIFRGEAICEGCL